MKKVAFLLDDRCFSNMDCSRPEDGNPGIGGTEYCFISVATAIARSGMSTILLHYNNQNKLPNLPCLTIFTIESSQEALSKKVLSSGITILVLRAEPYQAMTKTLKAINPQVSIVLWVHNHLGWQDLQSIGKDQQIKRTVFVGNEQHALAGDTCCRLKGVTIPNPFSMSVPSPKNNIQSSVVYVGSLIPSKGFHRLAKIWPEIIRQVPKARLEVIGSGKLYDRKILLGPLGLAEKDYEHLILRNLNGEPKNLGVTFHGLLKKERFELMAQCQVGVPNPTGLTECFPGSVLEMSACGLPIATIFRWGACDTVIDGITGLMSRNEKGLIKNIVTLIKDQKLSKKLGDKGKNWVQNKFSPHKVVLEWRKLFDAIETSPSDLSIQKSWLKPKGLYWWKPLYSLNHRSNPLLGNLRTMCTKVESWRLKR